MIQFPAKSAEAVVLEKQHFSLKDLNNAIKEAVKRKEQHNVEPVDANLFHLHTLSLQCTFVPLDEYVQYPDGPRANPDWATMNGILKMVQDSTDAFVPLTILPPSPNILGLPTVPQRGRQKCARLKPGRGPTLTMPAGKSAIVELPPVLVGHGRSFFQSTTAWDTCNWLNAALALSPSRPLTRIHNYRDDKERIHLRAGIDAVWIPIQRIDGDTAQLSLVINIEAYLDMTLINEPLPEIGRDLFSMTLNCLIPSPPTAATDAAGALREFYGCLRPAPDLPLDFNAHVLQPPQLVAELLPFQKRTVALLMSNEGEVMQGHAERQLPPGQWIELDFEGFGKYAFCRITGELRQLSQDRKGKGRASEDGAHPELSKLPPLFPLKKVKGSMLCEEMGLGKTVEAIALILLSRHPLSVPLLPGLQSAKQAKEVNITDPLPGHDEPRLKEWLAKEHAAFNNATSWSDEVDLQVAEVATTLVVTPLPLLKQWIAELATHAPSLRVCIYPGWNNLIQQVRAKRAAAVKSYQRREAAERKRKNTKFRNETRAKYARTASGRVKVEHEEESEDEDEDEDDDTSEAALDSLLQATQRSWVEYVRSYDVVLTTYQVLGDDLKVAHGAPPRSRRSTAKYNLEERPRSPLVMVEWWRVIMDEVQLQGDQSNASNMVSLVPRRCSLAMSGTPARSDVRDLIGSLKFLRVPNLNHVWWHRLIQPENRAALHGLFQRLAVRTTKAEIAHEFSLPAQSRYIVPIELSDIELHYYHDTLNRQLEYLRNNGPDDTTAFRTSLRHLRQICTHIQVGALQRGAVLGPDRGGRLQLGRTLLTPKEALQKIRTEHEANFYDLVKKQMREMLYKGQLVMMKEDDNTRCNTALALYRRVREQGEKILEPARANLEALKAERKKQLEQEGITREDSFEREDSAEPEVSRHSSLAERERAAKLTAAASLVRETLILIHQAWFLEGDSHHVLGQEKEEEAAYATAERLRKELLARSLKNANAAAKHFMASLADAPISDLDQLLTANTRLTGAIHTGDAVEQVNALLTILNDNATLVFSWREKIVKLLQTSVDPDERPAATPGEGQVGEDAEPEYYAAVLKDQGDLDAYLTVYAAAIADRKEMLLEQRTLLEVTEGRVTKKRSTRRALEAAADAAPEPLNESKDLLDGLMLERQAFRDRREELGCTRPLKGLMIDINGVTHGGYRPEEIAIAKDLTATIRKYLNEQVEYLEKLVKELDRLRATFNKRVTYFAALQEISDTVAVPEFTHLERDIQKATTEIGNLEHKIAANIRKGRFLSFLDTDGEKRDLHEDCAVCFGTSDDQFAIMLDCGHAFCETCLKELRKSPFMGNKCANCKEPIEPGKKYPRVRVRGASPTLGSTEVEMGEEDLPDDLDEKEASKLSEEAAERQRTADWQRLKLLDMSRYRDITSFDVMGTYGSKINFLVQHLMWYRATSPETRHVVFSNWADSLSIVERALTDNRIKFVSFDRNSKKNDVVSQFHADPTITVFLLHAERESAGLTLTSCGVVHLLEPVLQHSFELQAIGRVDRLGQKKETEVYCYATMGTVEQRILCRAVRNGTSIYLADKDKDEDTRTDDPMLNVASSARGGGDLALNTADSTGYDQLLSLIT